VVLKAGVSLGDQDQPLKPPTIHKARAAPAPEPQRANSTRKSTSSHLKPELPRPPTTPLPPPHPRHPGTALVHGKLERADDLAGARVPYVHNHVGLGVGGREGGWLMRVGVLWCVGVCIKVVRQSPAEAGTSLNFAELYTQLGLSSPHCLRARRLRQHPLPPSPHKQFPHRIRNQHDSANPLTSGVHLLNSLAQLGTVDSGTTTRKGPLWPTSSDSTPMVATHWIVLPRPISSAWWGGGFGGWGGWVQPGGWMGDWVGGWMGWVDGWVGGWVQPGGWLDCAQNCCLANRCSGPLLLHPPIITNADKPPRAHPPPTHTHQYHIDVVHP